MGTRMIPSFAGDWQVPGYTHERTLGRGASGKVVAAVSVATGQRVAIKYLSPALVRDLTFMWGFRAEAELQRSLDVPQVVRVFDYVEEPGRGAAIVMELVEGVSLHEMIGKHGSASPEAALVVLKGSLLGLAAAHAAGIVHRDYKPENVLVDAEGNSKLADFGVAVRAGKQALTAGTPLYMAPEQWNGAPSSPATDIYAVAAVFYECLTGKTPFSGKVLDLRWQHETAEVPVDAVTAPALRSLIARGMAKDPSSRPQGAMAFLSQLELLAAAAYGPEWEARGHRHLAVRAAALISLVPLLLTGAGAAGSSGSSSASTWLGGHTVRQAGRQAQRLGRKGASAQRKTVAIGTAAVVVAGAAVAAMALTGHQPPQAQLTSNATAASTTLPATQAAVLPPVAASHCTTPSSFRYRGTITAAAPGKVSYRWVYSSGKPGPVQTVDFAEAGSRPVTGETVATRKAGVGWGEIKTITPAASTSNKASYKLLCASGQTGVSTVAAIGPAAKSVACGAPVPTFTATGSITSQKAQAVTYYWSLSDGRATPAATLTFGKPGTLPAETLAITPQGDPSSGEAVLVATSPVAVSAPATYTLSCAVPLHLAASAAASPASEALSSCTTPAPAVTFTGTVSDNQTGPVSYYWKLPGGNGPVQTVNFTRAGAQAVTTTYRPSGDSVTGSGSIVVTSPGTVTSNAATFTLSCTKATASSLSVASSGAPTATLGVAYTGTVTAAGGKAPYKWATPTGLPGGLTATANGATLTISGTPTKTGPFTVGLSVSDAESPAKTATGSLPITVGAPALTVSADAPASATVNQAYSGTVTASGGEAPYTWAAPTGLPEGLTATANGATLTISGTPTGPGSSTIAVSVSDAQSPAKTATASVPVMVSTPPLVIDTASLPSGLTEDDYSATVTASGGTAPYTWSSSRLPGGMTIDPATGVISGSLGNSDEPARAGTYQVTVTVKDSTTSTSKQLSLVVTPLPLGLDIDATATVTSGTAFSTIYSAYDGTAPYTWNVTGLPAGLSASPSGSDDTISGTAPAVTAVTSVTVTITVTDAAGVPVTKTQTLTIDPPPSDG